MTMTDAQRDQYELDAERAEPELLDTPHPARTRAAVCAHRLDVDLATAHAICDRNIATCEAVVAHLADTWDAAGPESCCKRQTTDGQMTLGQPEYRMACEHLLRLWDARSYLQLAQAGAPKTGAFPCSCGGSGKYYSGGAVVNGQYTGTIGDCYRCSGKGWQTAADRKRNAYYDNHIRRFYI